MVSLKCTLDSIFLSSLDPLPLSAPQVDTPLSECVNMWRKMLKTQKYINCHLCGQYRAISIPAMKYHWQRCGKVRVCVCVCAHLPSHAHMHTSLTQCTYPLTPAHTTEFFHTHPHMSLTHHHMLPPTPSHPTPVQSTEELSVSCPECGKVYQTKPGLQYHLKSQHTHQKQVCVLQRSG